jgi:hypothetical protein
VSPLQRYRDDGAVAAWLARRAPMTPGPSALLATLLAAAPIAVLLAASRDRPAAAALLACAAWLVIIGAVGGRPRPGDRLAWAVPPAQRLVEYALLIRLTVVTDPAAMPACFALLGVLAFHHYDVVYRLRHQDAAPAPWVAAVAGGWDGRVLAACLLAVLGDQALRVGLGVAAAALAAVFLLEAATSWRRHGQTWEGA